MNRRILAGVVVVLLVSASADAQDVIFSRRVYATQGRTFQQLWVWSPTVGTLEPLTRSARSHEGPICSPDGTQVVFESGDGRFRFDRRTRVEDPVSLPDENLSDDTSGLHIPQCDDQTSSRSADGSRLACTANGEEIVIVDRRSLQEIGRVRFGQRSKYGYPYSPWSLQSTWSPTGERLLVGTYAGSSTAPALDYFLLDLATHQWRRAFTGNDAVWMPDAQHIVFTTQRDLVRLPHSSKHVWAAQLALFDVATLTQALLTSGVTNNEHPTICSSLR
jgi:Tol biopolymer transport system component